MSKTFVRTIDPLGRIILPFELRHELNWDVGENLKMVKNGEALVIRQEKKNCYI